MTCQFLDLMANSQFRILRLVFPHAQLFSSTCVRRALMVIFITFSVLLSDIVTEVFSVMALKTKVGR
jgi:hypothetical protein